MARVIQEANYIRKRKKKYLIGSLISTGIMIFIFIIGIIITKTRNNVFTVLAALLTLVVAQYGVQIISIICSSVWCTNNFYY